MILCNESMRIEVDSDGISDILIKYTSSGIESYEVKTFEDISINKSTPISPMPLPEEDSAENMLVKIEGNSTTMNLSWKIIPFTDDYSIGNGEIIWDGTLTKYRPTNQFAIDNTEIGRAHV